MLSVFISQQYVERKWYTHIYIYIYTHSQDEHIDENAIYMM